MDRLHRQFLELIQAELNDTTTDDLNSVQALILHAIGREEVLVGDLTQRGYYLGTNVSYNVRKLVEGAYLLQERSAHDRRALKLRLTDKGLRLCERLDRVFDTHIRELEEVAMIDDLAHASHVHSPSQRLLGTFPRHRLRLMARPVEARRAGGLTAEQPERRRGRRLERLEQRLERGARAEQPRADRADGDAERHARLLVAQPLEAHGDQHVALERRQQRDRMRELAQQQVIKLRRLAWARERRLDQHPGHAARRRAPAGAGAGSRETGSS